MSRTQRLRTEILSFLTEVGEANTTAILDHVNRRFRWGATMNQLGNVLAVIVASSRSASTKAPTSAGFACGSVFGPWRPLEAKESRIGSPRLNMAGSLGRTSP